MIVEIRYYYYNYLSVKVCINMNKQTFRLSSIIFLVGSKIYTSDSYEHGITPKCFKNINRKLSARIVTYNCLPQAQKNFVNGIFSS